jgi:RING-box protein 1
MADVEMTDAPPKTKTSKADAAADGKKRFEVKKVELHPYFSLKSQR